MTSVVEDSVYSRRV